MDSRDMAYKNRERKRRIQARKRKYRNRRIAALLILFIIIFLPYKLFSSKNKSSNEITIPHSLIQWHLDRIFDVKNKKEIHEFGNYSTEEEKFLSVYDYATTIKKKLVPNSNHITSAESYAYDTKLIREYIRGEKDYEDKDKLVFLTFDDGPNTTITPQILDTLEKNKVHATFFVVGKSVTPNHYSILKKTVMRGNALALHSFSHDYEKMYPQRSANTDAILEEAKLVQKRLEKVFGESFKVSPWRYPGGHMSWENLNEADNKLAEMNVHWIDWNSLSGDAEPRSHRPTTPEEQVAYLDKSLNKNTHKNVTVVLMHDATNKQLTADSLQSIIDYFKDKNYKFAILK
ncbi:MAG: polysaccharide deacetylase family protein [Peptoniphilaceae bacterium]